MSVPERDGTRLPAVVASLVDGCDLIGKVGQTFSLITVDDTGWPRLALLSVGEVYSQTGSDIKLALHAASGTTAALTASGRALLHVVVDAVNYRIRIQVERVDREPGPLAFFSGAVTTVDGDQAPYAELTSGITYRLIDEEAVVARWQRQLEQLKALGS